MSDRLPAHPERRPAVITGASAGIGSACATALAAAGYPVALGARRLERCETVAAHIRAAGGEAVAHPLDVRDTDSVHAFAEAVRRDLGEVEIVVSNAGTIVTSPVHTADTAQLAAELDVNILGAQRLIAALAPGMITRRRGDLVFVSSDVVRAPRPGVAGYVAGKWGLEGLVTALRMELEGTGVRASLVRPGPTMTEIAVDWDVDAVIALIDDWKRWGLVRHAGYLLPEDVARAVLTVVSAPRGTHLALVEVHPEAPLSKEPA